MHWMIGTAQYGVLCHNFNQMSTTSMRSLSPVSAGSSPIAKRRAVEASASGRVLFEPNPLALMKKFPKPKVVAKPGSSVVEAVVATSEMEGELAFNERKDFKTRAWCFTVNNPTEGGLAQERAFLSDMQGNHCQYYIRGNEIAPTTGTPHWQGYVYLDNALTNRGLRRKMPFLGRAALLAAKGTPLQNKKYCSKEGDFIEAGVVPCQGKRSDVSSAVDCLITNEYSLVTVAKQFPAEFVKMHRGLEALATMCRATRRTWKTKVYWLHGATGTGKSRWAFEVSESLKVPAFYKDCHSKWWDGLTEQRLCVLDDYRPDMCTFSALLNLFDQYPLSLEVKGGTRPCLFKYIIVTCPYTPEEHWKNQSEERLQQLLRRITYCVQFPVGVMDMLVLKDAKETMISELGGMEDSVILADSLERVELEQLDEHF